MIAKHPRN